MQNRIQKKKSLRNSFRTVNRTFVEYVAVSLAIIPQIHISSQMSQAVICLIMSANGTGCPMRGQSLCLRFFSSEIVRSWEQNRHHFRGPPAVIKISWVL